MTQKRGGGPQKGPGGGQRQMHVRLKTARKHRPSSQRWLERQLNDPYVAASKRDGMRSRAAYKLKEIDEKHRLLKPGAIVIDLGAAPGGWSQIAAERVQSIAGKGQVVAIDYLPMEALPGVEAIQLDFTAEKRPSRCWGTRSGKKPWTAPWPALRAIWVRMYSPNNSQ